MCNRASPPDCSSATVTVQVELNDVDVVDENITVLSGTTTTVPLLDNLTTSGARINAASMRGTCRSQRPRNLCQRRLHLHRLRRLQRHGQLQLHHLRQLRAHPVCVEGRVNVVVTADPVVLRLTKQATQRSVQVGDVVRYVVTVENMGDFDALGVTLLDTLPSGFTFIPGGFEAHDADNAARASGVAPLQIDGSISRQVARRRSCTTCGWGRVSGWVCTPTASPQQTCWAPPSATWPRPTWR